MSEQWPKWYRFGSTGLVIKRTDPTVAFWMRANGFSQPGHWGSAQYRMVETGELVPITEEEADEILDPTGNEWVDQTVVPIREGVDRGYWLPATTKPVAALMWEMDSRDRKEATGKKHGDKHPDCNLVLFVKCRRKDLPKARTVTLYEWLCWDEGGDEEIYWMAGPPVETAAKYGFKYFVKTGNTRTVEVPTND